MPLCRCTIQALNRAIKTSGLMNRSCSSSTRETILKSQHVFIFLGRRNSTTEGLTLYRDAPPFETKKKRSSLQFPNNRSPRLPCEKRLMVCVSPDRLGIMKEPQQECLTKRSRPRFGVGMSQMVYLCLSQSEKHLLEAVLANMDHRTW